MPYGFHLIQSHLVMSTRETFRHRRVASEALREIAARYSSIKDGSHIQPIIAFVQVCLQAASNEPYQSSRSPVTSATFAQIARVISIAVERHPRTKPAWTAEAAAILHLTERMLGILPSGRTYNSLIPSLAVHRRRSVSCGTYSTPDAIADQMCRDLLAEFAKVNQKSIDVADLSVEAGQFPLSLLGQEPKFRTRIFGMDRDQAAIEVAQRIFAFAQRQSGASDSQLRLAKLDSVIDPLPKGWPQMFDAIIGNPPWKTRHATDDAVLRRLFSPQLSGHFDVYLAFMLKANSYLKAGGILSMVVPSGFLFNQNAASVRSLLLNEYDILRVCIYPRRSFIELPCVIPISFVARKRVSILCERRRTNVVYCHGQMGHMGRRKSRSYAATSVWARLPGTVLHPTARADDLFLADMKHDSRLLDWGEFSCGAILGKRNGATSARDFVGLHARHLRPFHACPRLAIQYRRQSRAFDRAPPVQYLDRRKVLFQDMRCMTLANRLVAAVGGPGSLSVNTASMFIPQSDDNVDFFEALFNSQLVNAWYKLRDVNRDLRLNIVAQFPIIRDNNRWNQIAAIGRKISTIRRFHHRYLAACNFSNEKVILRDRFPKTWQEMSRLTIELDDEVCDLYKLSTRQRRNVQNLSRARIF